MLTCNNSDVKSSMNSIRNDGTHCLRPTGSKFKSKMPRERDEVRPVLEALPNYTIPKAEFYGDVRRYFREWKESRRVVIAYLEMTQTRKPEQELDNLCASTPTLEE